jgi:hypothetical protein
MRRQRLAHELALAKVVDQEETSVDEAGNTVYINKAADKENRLYDMKTRISYGFAGLSFVMGTFLFILLAAVLCYSAYVRANNSADVNFLAMVWDGLKASARDNGVTSYTAENASILSWILPFKPATLYTGIRAVASDSYLGWLVFPNIAVLCASAVAFIASTVKVIMDFVQKKSDKKALRMRRMYFVLLGGMVLALVAGLARGNVSALSSMLFHVLYLGFLPLIGMMIPEGNDIQEKALINVALCTVVAVFVLTFALALPAMYGYSVIASRAKLFTWMSFLF